MRTVALYARVSSEQQAEQETIGSQVAALKQRAEADGHRILPSDVYVDEGYSGASLLRPALERLRDQAAAGGLDNVYIHSPDRLARRYAYQVLLLEELRACGVSIIFLHGPSSATAEDELLVQVQGMIAEYERAKILERCRRGKLHRARQGLVNPLSNAPFGYLYVRKSDMEPARYEILLPEAKVVRQIFEWLVYGQKSIGEITRRLNEASVPTQKDAAHWCRSTVWGVLRNPAYIGKAAFGKTEAVERGQLLRPIRGKPSIPRRRKSAYRDRPSDEWITIDVPPIISQEVFAAAAEQLDRNRRLSERNARGRRYLLQGLVVCGKCGYAYYGKQLSRSAAKGKPRRYAYYRCVGTDAYRFGGKRVCDNKQIRVDQLDGYVWESVESFLRSPERLESEWRRRATSDGLQRGLRQRQEEASKLVAKQEKSLERLLDAYEAGALDLDELNKRTSRIRARLSRAQDEFTAAKTRLAEAVDLRAVIGRFEDFATRIRGRLDVLTWDERRDLIRTLVSRVEIDEEGATVVYRVPGGSGPKGPAHEDKPSGGQSDTDGSKSMLLRTGRDHTTLWRPFPRRCRHTVLRTRGV